VTVHTIDIMSLRELSAVLLVLKKCNVSEKNKMTPDHKVIESVKRICGKFAVKSLMNYELGNYLQAKYRVNTNY
jgi:hypothetical protein